MIPKQPGAGKGKPKAPPNQGGQQVPHVHPPKSKLKKLHDFKVGQVVDVYFPKKDPFYLGRAKVTETGRKMKGKDYDIEIHFEHSGEPKAVHAHHLKPVKKPEDYPEILDQAKVETRPVYRHDYAGTTENVTPDLEDAMRDHFAELPHPDDEEAKKPLGCTRCHNGDLYAKGAQSLWKTREGQCFKVMPGTEYIILVPARFKAGNVSFRNRRKVEECPRCEGGMFMELSTKHDGSGSIKHKTLLRMGYIGLITMPVKKF